MPSDDIALDFFFKKKKKRCLGKNWALLPETSMPSYGIPFTKFPQEVLGSHKQKY